MSIFPENHTNTHDLQVNNPPFAIDQRAPARCQGSNLPCRLKQTRALVVELLQSSGEAFPDAAILQAGEPFPFRGSESLY